MKLFNSFLFFLFSSLVLLPSSFCFSSTPPAIKQICSKDQCISVEVVDTPINRARGLQGRQNLAKDSGMLFVFEAQGIYDFWMKDTLIELDMIWIDQDKTIVDIKTNVPVCSADPCPIYSPSGQAKYVLEINAGRSQTLNIKIGDQLTFK